MGDNAAPFNLRGQVALVTGGSRGLGREIVLGLARAGADVVVSSRKLGACEKVAQEVEGTTGRRAVAIACHVGHWDELTGLVDSSYAALGKLDILVNNAGIAPLYPDPTSVTEALYDKVLAVNLKGPFRLTALVAARMARTGGGSIINISSFGSVNPTADIIPYAAAKAGLNAMTIAFARAFAPNVRVNCVLPGAFQTDATTTWDDDTVQRFTEGPALGRMGDPDEIVGSVLYLASGASSYTTGALLRVDGGLG
jgi:NAD(P)-dependent dehydrogenase (short-subunit alcohol dehydrogenase family)